MIYLFFSCLALTFGNDNDFLSGVLENEIRVGERGEEHREGELVAIALAVELLGVLKQVDEGVDKLGRVVLVCHHSIGLHFTQITVPDKGIYFEILALHFQL